MLDEAASWRGSAGHQTAAAGGRFAGQAEMHILQLRANLAFLGCDGIGGIDGALN
jgi:hypothetical protein